MAAATKSIAPRLRRSNRPPTISNPGQTAAPTIFLFDSMTHFSLAWNIRFLWTSPQYSFFSNLRAGADSVLSFQLSGYRRAFVHVGHDLCLRGRILLIESG